MIAGESSLLDNDDCCGSGSSCDCGRALILLLARLAVVVWWSQGWLHGGDGGDGGYVCGYHLWSIERFDDSELQK